jgi:hypothetical protein
MRATLIVPLTPLTKHTSEAAKRMFASVSLTLGSTSETDNSLGIKGEYIQITASISDIAFLASLYEKATL